MRIARAAAGMSFRVRMATLAGVLALAAAGVSVLGPGAQAGDQFRVDAIFDTAKGIIPGNAVKIAGARVGTVKEVVLTRDYRARIQMTVDGRFAPFRSDARCDLQQEALIGERFVQCGPGTADGTPLRATGGHAPTVPVENTSVPVSFTDLFNIFKLPVRQRFGVTIASLGLGLAGRGDDLNHVLRRANPTLQLIRRAFGILNRQRAQLAAVVTATDRIAAELAPRSARVREFIRESAGVMRQTAGHRTALAEAVRRLPALLDATEPALHRLDAFTRSGTPLLADLRAAAPQLQRFVAGLEPFSRVGRPAVRDLGLALTRSRPLVRRVTPQFRQLGVFARDALPTGRLLGQLFTSFRDTGFVEGLLNLNYGLAAGGARYDAIAHILPINLIFNNCVPYAAAPAPGCNTNWQATPVTQATTPTGRRPRRANRHPAFAPPVAPKQLPDLHRPTVRVPGLPPIRVPRLPKIGAGGGRAPAPSERSNAVKHLFDYLLR